MNQNFELHVPVVFNFFNREDTAMAVFNTIKRAKPKKLYLVSDGPRANKEGEAEAVNALREKILSAIDWDCEVKKNFAEANMGCRDRIVSGYNWVFEQEEMAILLEDDTCPLQSFYPYAQELLEKYKDDERIFLIAGNNLNQSFEIKDSYAFTRFPSTWGWATWARAWHCYDGSYETFRKLNAAKTHEQFYGKYLSKLYLPTVEKGFDGTINTWDWQWEACRMYNFGIGICPKVNMIQNIGFNSAEATHTEGKCLYDFTAKEMEFPLKHPETVLPNIDLDNSYLENIVSKELQGATFIGKVKRRIRLFFAK